MLMVRVTREGGEPKHMTIRSALKLIPREVNLGQFTAGLDNAGIVPVQLTDGTVATMQLMDEEKAEAADPQDNLPFDGPYVRPSKDDPPDPALAYRPIEVDPCYAHVKLNLEMFIDVAVSNVVDQDHAEQVIEEVFRGDKPPPEGFKIIFDIESLRAFMKNVHDMLATNGASDRLGPVQAVTMSFFSPQPIPQLVYQEKP